VNTPQAEVEMDAVRRAIKRGCPFGDDGGPNLAALHEGQILRNHGAVYSVAAAECAETPCRSATERFRVPSPCRIDVLPFWPLHYDSCVHFPQSPSTAISMVGRRKHGMSGSQQSDAWAPSFVGIGAEKSATTWVWSKLDQHPTIEMSQPKELNYFNENFGRGSAWYQKHFVNSTDCLQGEISPWYMDHAETAERIARVYPDIRLLVILRNPFDRAMSHLMHDAQNEYGGIADLTAEQLQQLVVRDEKYVRRSSYASSLDRYFDHFDRDQIGVYFYDDVKERPRQLIQEIYKFLGVDASFVPDDLATPLNKSQDYRSVTLHRIASRVSQTAKAFPVTRDLIEWIYRNTTLRERTIDLLMVDSGRPELRAADVLSGEQIAAIASDLERLPDLLNVSIPTTWSVPACQLG
jgi:hypothetical protein